MKHSHPLPAHKTRREFLSRSAGGVAAIATGIGAPIILTSRKSVVRASSFPSFNQAGISSSTLNSFTSIFLTMANDMYHQGSVSTANLNSAQACWGALYQQLLSSGFDSAAVQYINAGVPSADQQLNPLYNLLVGNGLQQGWGYFYYYLSGNGTAGFLNSMFNANVIPAFNAYGVPDSNYGHQCSLSHFAGGSDVPSAPQLPPVGRGMFPQMTPCPSPAGSQTGGVAPNCAPLGGGGSPGFSEDFCWWMNGFLAYVGIMAIPLSLEGAAFPPLGVGLGIAAAFAGAFSWAFC